MGSQGYSGTGWSKRGDRKGIAGHGTFGASEGRVFGSGQGGSGYRGGGDFGTEGIHTSKAPAHKPKQSKEAFEVGDRIDHKTFGKGVIIEVEKDQLTIQFDNQSATKRLLVGYAPIVKIK